MKLFKTIALIFLIGFLSTVGVYAEDVSAPGFYVESNGTVTKVPTTLTQVVGSSEVKQSTTGTTSSLSFSNENGGTGNWYWCGSTNQNETASILEVSLDTASTGTLNLVIGPNGSSVSDGSTASMLISNQQGWTLGNNQTINIYQGATSDNPAEISRPTCSLNLYNYNPAQIVSENEKPVSALTINGTGTLNVNSGIFISTAMRAPGLTLSSGSIQVSSTAQFQPIYNMLTTVSKDGKEPAGATTVDGEGTANLNIKGLSISGGSLTNSGFLKVVQNVTDTSWDYAGIELPSNGLGFNINGGTVQTSDSCPTGLANGIWIQSFGNGTSMPTTNIKSSTDIINSYGTVTLNTGVFQQIDLTGNNTLTVNNGALTIPDNYVLNFGENTTVTNPTCTLTVSQNSSLIINPKAQVNMNSSSKLENSGAIEVNE